MGNKPDFPKRTAEEIAPKRIQRQRTKGWRMPSGAVYVGRPTRWANPFGFALAPSGREKRLVHLPSGRPIKMLGIFDVVTSDPAKRRYNCTEAFEMWIDGQSDEARSVLDATMFCLRGLDLVCWCPLDHPCHADVLLRIANQ